MKIRVLSRPDPQDLTVSIDAAQQQTTSKDEFTKLGEPWLEAEEARKAA